VDIWELSEKVAKVVNEHRIVTRVAGLVLCVYCTHQIYLARELMVAAIEYEDLERSRLIIDNAKFIIGQFVGMLTIAFSVYSGTGGKK